MGTKRRDRAVNTNLRDYINKWLEKAEHDMEAAQLVIEMKPMILDIACFHCQQAVEKYLKAFLIFNNKTVIKTHSIELLIEFSGEIDSDFSDFDFKNLDEYAVEIRYPDSFLQPDLTETKEYYSIALEIQKLVLQKINA